MKSLSSTGFIGSWCCSCVTSSLRKSSLPSIGFSAAWAAPVDEAAGVVLELLAGVVLLMLMSCSLCEDVDCAGGKRQARRVDRGLHRKVVGVRVLVAAMAVLLLVCAVLFVVLGGAYVEPVHGEALRL